MINPKILILPDSHGRTFYKKALCEAVDKGAEIVCLGDYLDPYPGDELHEKGVFAPLKELVEVKKQHPGRVHLLIGNHDSSYMLNRHLCEHRYDYKQAPFYQKFFRENYDLFELAYLTEVNSKRFLFSHAGISKYWLKNNEQFFGADVPNPEKVLALLDNGLKIYKKDVHNDSLLRVLAQIGMGRGGRYLDGSMIWADLDEYVSEKSFPWNDVIQIFGHSQQELHPVRIGDRAYCLDCRQPFYIDQEGVLRSYYWDDETIKAINIERK